MKALLTTNHIYCERQYFSSMKDRESHENFKKQIKENQGKWIDIETDRIFDNQYNTKIGRIYDAWIDKIKDDVRTDKNIFFVKHPNGKDPIKKVDFRDHLKNERFLSCYSTNGNYYRISRRSNIEFILVGGEIYTSNSIGYTPLKKSRLSENEKKIVQYCAERILNNNF